MHCYCEKRRDHDDNCHKILIMHAAEQHSRQRRSQNCPNHAQHKVVERLFIIGLQDDERVQGNPIRKRQAKSQADSGSYRDSERPEQDELELWVREPEQCEVRREEGFRRLRQSCSLRWF